jgi:hypothetical protein
MFGGAAGKEDRQSQRRPAEHLDFFENISG